MWFKVQVLGGWCIVEDVEEHPECHCGWRCKEKNGLSEVGRVQTIQGVIDHIKHLNFNRRVIGRPWRAGPEKPG